MEALARLETLGLDKTGTLTEGQFRLQHVLLGDASNGDLARLMRMAGSVETLSAHPLAAAFLKYCDEMGVELVEPTHFELLEGEGVRATVDGVVVHVGGERLARRIIEEKKKTRLARRITKGGDADAEPMPARMRAALERKQAAADADAAEPMPARMRAALERAEKAPGDEEAGGCTRPRAEKKDCCDDESGGCDRGGCAEPFIIQGEPCADESCCPHIKEGCCAQPGLPRCGAPCRRRRLPRLRSRRRRCEKPCCPPPACCDPKGTKCCEPNGRCAESGAECLPQVLSPCCLPGGECVHGVVEGEAEGADCAKGCCGDERRAAAPPPLSLDSAAVRSWKRSGGSVLWVLLDGELAAVCQLSDQIRAESVNAIAALERLGVSSVMLTGDARETAEAIGEEAGIREVNAAMLPQEKLDAIERLRRSGLVGMVGDGINDGPALAAADVGIAMGAGGSAIASQAAGVVLMSNDLRRIADAIDGSHRCLRTTLRSIVVSLLLKIVPLVLIFAVDTRRLIVLCAVGSDVLGIVFVLANAMVLMRMKPRFAESPCASNDAIGPQVAQQQPQKLCGSAA